MRIADAVELEKSLFARYESSSKPKAHKRHKSGLQVKIWRPDDIYSIKRRPWWGHLPLAGGFEPTTV